MNRRPFEKSRNARAGAFALLGFAACVLWVKPMGLLFWARIRILTNIPRTALAEPETRVGERQFDLGATTVATRIELPAEPPRDPFAPFSRARRYERNSVPAVDRAGEAKSAADSVE